MSVPERLSAALADRYTIERELGAGGMATVYLAADLKHDRQVAIKVLRPELAAVVGAERFVSEIRTTANLQHPHILPLFDSGEADGFLFYVMPYVGGESLREKLDREKQLRVDEALDYARKIGDALDYAHEQGVVHRDIKPANVLLSARGEPLVADFGIALAVSQAGEGRITETGLSLGTPHYMSPEQATGDRDVDPRSDIYALGCVMYEMLAGQPPFAAPTAQAVLARILTETPRRVTDLRRTVPPHVASVIAKALEKLPADRFSSVREVMDALGREGFTYMAEVPTSTGGHTSVSRSASRVSPLVIGLAAALVVSLGVAAVGWLGRGGATSDVAALAKRATVTLPSEFSWAQNSVVRVAPDDRHLLALDSSGVWVRGIADPDFRRLPDTDGAIDARFSPDGRELVVTDGTEVFRVGLDGSNRRTVFDGEGIQTAPAWGDDGYGYYIELDPGGTSIMRASMSGGTPPEQVAEQLAIPVIYSSADPLPGGGRILASSVDLTSGVRMTRLIDVATGDSVTVLEDGGDARWVETGHLAFVDSRGDLRAVPFDLESGLPTAAQAVQLERGVGSPQPYGTRVSISRQGTLVYSEGDAFSMIGLIGESTSLLEISFSGDTIQHAEAPFFIGPRWSPDGRYLAYGSGGAFLDAGVLIYDVELGLRPRAVATDVPYSLFAEWSPDGQRLVVLGGEDFSRARPFVAEAFGPGSAVIEGLPESTGAGDLIVPVAWTEQGLIYTIGIGSSAGIWTQTDLSEPAERWLPADASAGAGLVALSPQGDFIAYATRNPAALTVRAFPDIGPPVEIVEGAVVADVHWGPDGNALYYAVEVTGARYELHRVEVTREPVFAPLDDEVVMQLGAVNGLDIHPDGDRIIVAAQVAGETTEDAGDATDVFEATPDQTWIVFNWFERIREAFGEDGTR